MNEGLIPRRYAKALYKVAVERNCSDRIYSLMQQLAATFASSEQLRALIANPFVEAADKEAAVTAAAGAAATDETFADFLKLLIQNRRMDLCASVANAYVDIFRKERNIRRVEVISAAPLDSAVEKRIKSVIEEHLHGATMEFSAKVDPALIGGFIVTVDNERLDASLRNRLKEIRLNLLNK